MANEENNKYYLLQSRRIKTKKHKSMKVII